MLDRRSFALSAELVFLHGSLNVKKKKKMREHYTVKQQIGGSAPLSLIAYKNSRKNIFLSIL